MHMTKVYGINHHIFSNNLYSIDICEPFISLLISYLTDKKHIVKLKNAHSDPYNIPSSVPQGSNLVPLFILLFIFH